MAATLDDIRSLQARNRALGKSNDSLHATADRGRDDFCSAMDASGKLDAFLEASLETSGVRDFYRDTKIGDRAAPQRTGDVVDRYLKDNLDHAANDAHHSSARKEAEGHGMDAMLEAHAQPGADPKAVSMESELFAYRRQMTEFKIGAKDSHGVPVEKPDLSSQWKDHVADHVTRGVAKEDAKTIEALGSDRESVASLVERRQALNAIATHSLDMGHNREKIAHLAEQQHELPRESPAISAQAEREESRDESRTAPTVGVFGESAEARSVEPVAKAEKSAGPERGRRPLEGRPRVTQEQADRMGQWQENGGFTPEQHREFQKGEGGALYERGVEMVRDLRAQSAKRPAHEVEAKVSQTRRAAPELRVMLEAGIGAKLEKQRERKAEVEQGS